MPDKTELSCESHNAAIRLQGAIDGVVMGVTVHRGAVITTKDVMTVCEELHEWHAVGQMFGFADPTQKPQDIAIALENLKMENESLLLKVAQLEEKKPEGWQLMRAMKAAMYRRECQPVDSVWRSCECPKCKRTMLWDNGDERDVTTPDVEAVKCWHCAAVTFLGPDRERKRMPKDWKRWAVETYQSPRQCVGHSDIVT